MMDIEKYDIEKLKILQEKARIRKLTPEMRKAIIEEDRLRQKTAEEYLAKKRIKSFLKLIGWCAVILAIVDITYVVWKYFL